MYYIEWRFPIRIENKERSAYSEEKRQTMFGKLPSCIVTTSLWQNPRIFDI